MNKSVTAKQRKAMVKQSAEQRSVEAAGGEAQFVGGTVLELTAGSSAIEREFFDFYRTSRGEVTPQATRR